MERFGPVTLSGLLRRHSPADEGGQLHNNVSHQWDDYFARRQAPPRAGFHYGVFQRMADGDLTFDYFSGAPVEPNLSQPADFTTLQVPALYWAVFRHTGHVSEIKAFMRMVFGTVLPMAGIEPAPDGPGVPEFLERYPAGYDPEKPGGGFDLMVPVKE